MSIMGNVAEALLQDSVYAALMVDAQGDHQFHSATSLGQEDIDPRPPFPYLVWNELPSNPFVEVEEQANAERRVFTFSVYDELGSFDRINLVLKRVREIVKGLGYFVADDGTQCLGTHWAGFSGQIQDPGYTACMRFGTAYFDTID